MTTFTEALNQLVLNDRTFVSVNVGLAHRDVPVSFSDEWENEIHDAAMRTVVPEFNPQRASCKSIPALARIEGHARCSDATHFVFGAARSALYRVASRNPDKPARSVAFTVELAGIIPATDAIVIVSRKPGLKDVRAGGAVVIVKRSELPSDIRLTAEEADDPIMRAFHEATHSPVSGA